MPQSDDIPRYRKKAKKTKWQVVWTSEKKHWLLGNRYALNYNTRQAADQALSTWNRNNEASLTPKRDGWTAEVKKK